MRSVTAERITPDYVAIFDQAPIGTVVYDRDHVYGDPAMIHLATEDGRLAKLALTRQDKGFLHLFSGIAGLLGLLAATFLLTVRASS